MASLASRRLRRRQIIGKGGEAGACVKRFPTIGSSIVAIDPGDLSCKTIRCDSHDAGHRPRVKQLRLVIEAEDFDGARTFCRDALGRPRPDDIELRDRGGSADDPHFSLSEEWIHTMVGDMSSSVLLLSCRGGA